MCAAPNCWTASARRTPTRPSATKSVASTLVDHREHRFCSPLALTIAEIPAAVLPSGNIDRCDSGSVTAGDGRSVTDVLRVVVRPLAPHENDTPRERQRAFGRDWLRWFLVGFDQAVARAAQHDQLERQQRGGSACSSGEGYWAARYREQQRPRGGGFCEPTDPATLADYSIPRPQQQRPRAREGAWQLCERYEAVARYIARASFERVTTESSARTTAAQTAPNGVRARDECQARLDSLSHRRGGRGGEESASDCGAPICATATGGRVELLRRVDDRLFDEETALLRFALIASLGTVRFRCEPDTDLQFMRFAQMTANLRVCVDDMNRFEQLLRSTARETINATSAAIANPSNSLALILAGSGTAAAAATAVATAEAQGATSQSGAAAGGVSTYTVANVETFVRNHVAFMSALLARQMQVLQLWIARRRAAVATTTDGDGRPAEPPPAGDNALFQPPPPSDPAAIGGEVTLFAATLDQSRQQTAAMSRVLTLTRKCLADMYTNLHAQWRSAFESARALDDLSARYNVTMPRAVGETLALERVGADMLQTIEVVRNCNVLLLKVVDDAYTETMNALFTRDLESLSDYASLLAVLTAAERQRHEMSGDGGGTGSDSLGNDPRVGRARDNGSAATASRTATLSGVTGSDGVAAAARTATADPTTTLLLQREEQLPSLRQQYAQIFEYFSRCRRHYHEGNVNQAPRDIRAMVLAFFHIVNAQKRVADHYARRGGGFWNGYETSSFYDTTTTTTTRTTRARGHRLVDDDTDDAAAGTNGSNATAGPRRRRWHNRTAAAAAAAAASGLSRFDAIARNALNHRDQIITSQYAEDTGDDTIAWLAETRGQRMRPYGDLVVTLHNLQDAFDTPFLFRALDESIVSLLGQRLVRRRGATAVTRTEQSRLHEDYNVMDELLRANERAFASSPSNWAQLIDSCRSYEASGSSGLGAGDDGGIKAASSTGSPYSNTWPPSRRLAEWPYRHVDAFMFTRTAAMLTQLNRPTELRVVQDAISRYAFLLSWMLELRLVVDLQTEENNDNNDDDDDDGNMGQNELVDDDIPMTGGTDGEPIGPTAADDVGRAMDTAALRPLATAKRNEPPVARVPPRPAVKRRRQEYEEEEDEEKQADGQNDNADRGTRRPLKRRRNTSWREDNRADAATASDAGRRESAMSIDSRSSDWDDGDSDEDMSSLDDATDESVADDGPRRRDQGGKPVRERTTSPTNTEHRRRRRRRRRDRDRERVIASGRVDRRRPAPTATTTTNQRSRRLRGSDRRRRTAALQRLAADGEADFAGLGGLIDLSSLNDILGRETEKRRRIFDSINNTLTQMRQFERP